MFNISDHLQCKLLYSTTEEICFC